MTVDIENRRIFVIGMALLMLPLAIAGGGILAKVQQAASLSDKSAPNSLSSLLQSPKPKNSAGLKATEKRQSQNLEVAPATPAQPEPSPNSMQIQGLHRLVIKTCAGTPSGANFRRSPNGAIVGFVPAGEAVYLLGETATNQGTWNKVINEAPLGAVPEAPDASRNRQIGWISSCFVE